ncbi:MAG: hypothetical protein RR446_09195, partial [Lachnospiraceae bacterium]
MHQKEYKEKQQKIRMKYRIYAGAALIMAAAVIVAVVFLLFRVQKIEVMGTEYSNSTQVVKWIQEDRFSQNSLYLLLRDKVSPRAIPPYLEEVHIRLKTPWIVQA